MLSKIISLLEQAIERDFTTTEDFENWNWGKSESEIEIEYNNTLYRIDYSLKSYKKLTVTITLYDRARTKAGVRYFPAYTSNTPIVELISYAFVYLLRERYDELEREEEEREIAEKEAERDYEAMQDTYASLEKQFYPPQFF